MTKDQQQVAAELVAVWPDALAPHNRRSEKLCADLAQLGVCTELLPREDTTPHGAWLANPVFVDAVRGDPSSN